VSFYLFSDWLGVVCSSGQHYQKLVHDCFSVSVLQISLWLSFWFM